MSCNNCRKQSRYIFKNDVIFCFGLVKNKYKKPDEYRYCIEKNKQRTCSELMLEELYAMLQGLSTILTVNQIEKTNKKK